PTARRVSSIASRLPGTNRLGFQPSLALSGSADPHKPLPVSPIPCDRGLVSFPRSAWECMPRYAHSSNLIQSG
ncbi:MAG: hypothetical protein ABW095_07840, partial [Candidatus Thiodiazotropha sp.]